MTTNLVERLRVWTRDHDDHVRAAVELLIEHDYWLRSRRFVDAAVVDTEEVSYIAWYKARTAYDQGKFDRSSTSELAILDVATALGEDRYRITNLGRTNRWSVTRAVMAATGFPSGKEKP